MDCVTCARVYSSWEELHWGVPVGMDRMSVWVNIITPFPLCQEMDDPVPNVCWIRVSAHPNHNKRESIHVTQVTIL